MKPYPKYKPSDIQWLGDIPEHWEVKKLKYVSNVQPSNVDKKSYEEEVPVSLCNYVDVYKNEFIDERIFFMQATATESEIEKFRLKIGDVLITKDSESPKDIAVPAYVRIERENLLCGYHLAQITGKNSILLGSYIFRLFQSKDFNTNFEIAANGITRYGLGIDSIKNVAVTIPPIPEQTAIAQFLDQKTAQIDNLIAQKQRLITLLKEERIAFINEILSDKSFPLKKLKYVVEGKLEYGANESAELDDRSLPRYIRITDFGNNGKLKDETFKSLPFEKANEYLLKDGDILFARSGATVGKTFQFKNYEGIACFAGYLIKAMPNPKVILSDYLYYFTKSGIYENWKDSIFVQATIQNIGADKYNQLEIPVPSLKTQQKIVESIERTTGKIDATLVKIVQEIELLKEYRMALISEVVTGKISVI